MQITTLAQDRHGPLKPSKFFLRRTTGIRAGNFDTKDRDTMRRRTTTSFKGLPPLGRSVEELGFAVIFTKNQGARFRAPRSSTPQHTQQPSRNTKYGRGRPRR